jgi:two-component system, sensor histidine kinase LadS
LSPFFASLRLRLRNRTALRDAWPLLGSRGRFWWLVALLLGLGGLMAWAWPSGHRAPSAQQAAQLDIWIDASGLATLEQARQQNFRPAPAILGRGYTPSATWWRVSIAAQPEPVLLLTVKPSQLDDVQLYRQSPSGQWQMQQSGDRHAFGERDRKELAPTFALALEPHASTVVYLRVQTTSTHMTQVLVRPPESAQNEQELILLFIGIYTGLVLLLACSSFINYFLHKDIFWLATMGFQVAGAIGVLTGTSLHGKYIWPDQPALADAVFSASVALHVALGNIFYYLIFRHYGAPVWIRRIFLLAICVLPVQWLAIATDNTRWAMTVNSQLVLVATLLSFIVVWRLLSVPNVELRRLIRLTYTFYLVYLIFHILPVLGIGPLTLVHLYPPALLSNLFSALMLHLIVLQRQRLREQEQQAMGEQFRIAQQQLVWEQQRRTEATSFLGILLHELKTPLASIRLAAMMLETRRSASPQDRAQRLQTIGQSVHDMDSVLERCRQVDRLEQGNWELHTQSEDVSALIRQSIAALPAPQAQRIQLTQPPQLIAQVEASLVQTMVKNLLDNALTYSAPHSVVTLELLHQDHPSPRWVLTVRNRIGKAGAPDPQKVFQKYYRAGGAHQYTGSGLGLFLVKNLAALAGGGLSHRNDADQVIFELWHPCT